MAAAVVVTVVVSIVAVVLTEQAEGRDQPRSESDGVSADGPTTEPSPTEPPATGVDILPSADELEYTPFEGERFTAQVPAEWTVIEFTEEAQEDRALIVASNRLRDPDLSNLSITFQTLEFTSTPSPALLTLSDWEQERADPDNDRFEGWELWTLESASPVRPEWDAALLEGTYEDPTWLLPDRWISTYRTVHEDEPFGFEIIFHFPVDAHEEYRPVVAEVMDSFEHASEG